MAEIPKLELLSPCSSSSCSGSGEALESEQKNVGAQSQRISVSDHINAFQYTAEEADSFVIDMDAFSSAITKDNTTNANSRITRSLSRKGSHPQRGGDRKLNGNATLHDKDTVPATCSPKAIVGSCTPEKGAVVGVGPTDHSINPHIHHQISITASGTESKSMIRRNSFRRSSSLWALDPKRVKHGNHVADILHSHNQSVSKMQMSTGVDWKEWMRHQRIWVRGTHSDKTACNALDCGVKLRSSKKTQLQEGVAKANKISTNLMSESAKICPWASPLWQLQ